MRGSPSKASCPLFLECGYKDVLFTGDSLMRKNDGVAIVPLRFDKIADGHAGVASGAKEKLARFLAGS